MYGHKMQHQEIFYCYAHHFLPPKAYNKRYSKSYSVAEIYEIMRAVMPIVIVMTRSIKGFPKHMHCAKHQLAPGLLQQMRSKPCTLGQLDVYSPP